MLSYVWLFCNPLDCSWEILKVGGEGDDRGWDGWMASLTQWTWVWASSGRLWRTGKPGVLQSMGLQRVRHNGTTEHQDCSPPVLSPWDFPGKNIGVSCHFLLQGIFLIQEFNPCLLISRQILDHWATREAPSLPKQCQPSTLSCLFLSSGPNPLLCGYRGPAPVGSRVSKAWTARQERYIDIDL